MKNRNFPWAIIAAAAVAGAGFAGVANYVRQDQSKQSAVSQNADDPNGVTVSKDPLSGTNTPVSDTNNAENHQTVRTSKVDSLNKAIKANFSDKGIRVLDVTVEDRNAIVDMNAQVQYNWGSEEEASFLNLMKDTLAKFDSVDTFQIRVEGQILKSLSHFEVDHVKVR